MHYTIYALLASTFFAFSTLMSKFASKHRITSANSLMGYFLLASSTLTIFLVPFTALTIPPITILWKILIAVITFLVGYYLFYRGIFETDASSFSPLFILQSALIAFFAYIFLGERFPLSNYLYLLLIIFGAVLTNFDESISIKSFFKKGVLYILGMQVLHAISNLFVGFAITTLTPIDYIFWQYLIITILTGIYFMIVKPKLSYSPKTLTPMFLAAWLGGIGAIFLFTAFQTNLTITATLSLLSAPIVLVITFLASRFYPSLLEHHSGKIYLLRSIGLLIILFATYSISRT